MSEGIRSGVNWMRENFQSNAAASALTISVLASPGTPTSRACEPVSAQVSSRSIVSSCPTTTSWSRWRMLRTRSVNNSTRCWANSTTLVSAVLIRIRAGLPCFGYPRNAGEEKSDRHFTALEGLLATARILHPRHAACKHRGTQTIDVHDRPRRHKSRIVFRRGKCLMAGGSCQESRKAQGNGGHPMVRPAKSTLLISQLDVRQWCFFHRCLRRLRSFPRERIRELHGKKFRKSQELDLQDGCSEIEALFQVRHAIVRRRQEWRSGSRCQSGFAKLDRESQKGSGSCPRD